MIIERRKFIPLVIRLESKLLLKIFICLSRNEFFLQPSSSFFSSSSGGYFPWKFPWNISQSLTVARSLKLVSAIFCQTFIFSPNDKPLKTMNNVFYFIEKALFVLEIFKFCNFSPYFPHFPDSKDKWKRNFQIQRTNGCGII